MADSMVDNVAASNSIAMEESESSQEIASVSHQPLASETQTQVDAPAQDELLSHMHVEDLFSTSQDGGASDAEATHEQHPGPLPFQFKTIVIEPILIDDDVTGEPETEAVATESVEQQEDVTKISDTTLEHAEAEVTSRVKEKQEESSKETEQGNGGEPSTDVEVIVSEVEAAPTSRQ